MLHGIINGIVLYQAERVKAAPTARILNVVDWWCGPRPSYGKWAEMARQLSRGVRPSGHPQRLELISFFRLAVL